MIKIKYQNNGVQFKRSWTKKQYIEAATRIAVLRESGIVVKVTGFQNAAPQAATGTVPPESSEPADAAFMPKQHDD